MKIKPILPTIFAFLALMSIPAVGQLPMVSPTPTATAPTPAIRYSNEDELMADLKLGPCDNEERLVAVKSLLKRIGVAESDIKIEKFEKIQNVTVTKKGRTAETVVVGAHYDKVADGCGIFDNWTGVVIMAHLYRTISTIQTEKTYVFVAFDREEVGLKGSKAMAGAIPKDSRSTYCTMINLDSFGMGYPVILDTAANPKLLKVAKELGKVLNVPVNEITVPGAGADSMSFNSIKVPAITFSGFSGKWAEYMHTSKDKFEAVIPASMRIGYQFGLQYLARMDAAGCSDFK